MGMSVGAAHNFPIVIKHVHIPEVCVFQSGFFSRTWAMVIGTRCTHSEGAVRRKVSGVDPGPGVNDAEYVLGRHIGYIVVVNC